MSDAPNGTDEVLHLTQEREGGAAPDRASASDAHVMLMAGLRQLPAAQREAIALHHLADLLRAARDRGVGLEVSPPAYDALHTQPSSGVSR